MSNPPQNTPMASENFLYLLSELEQAVARDTIKWDAAAALSAQKRLDRLAAILRRIAAEARDPRPEPAREGDRRDLAGLT
jgi:hypothetical protein